MADESVVVELLMTASQFIGEAQKAASAAKSIGTSTKQTSQEATTGMDRMRQSARENSAEWKTVGGTLTKVGLTQAAFATSVALTGGNYNRLQQTSRAALSSVLGGTRAATAQMDKLDAWATKSPFSRAVWIDAQQQLLAFGVEAQKVIPYMDGIQNAVAAAGGSEAHLRGITEIMAKISSSSKITGQDLNQFGNWGVNAAELIGLSMGKTGAQIREEITAGTLDAEAALDALAHGMSTKFAGAAANVKNTFDGAFDRVKAAFRDVSAEIMEPFIGKQGGGMFTSMLNGVADLLRAFQKLPAPVKDFTAAFGLATTALTLGGGALMSAAPKVLELHRSLTLLGEQGVPVVSKLASSWAAIPGQLGGAFADVRGSFSSVSDAMTLATQMGVSKAQALKVGVGSAFSGIKSGAKGVGSALLNAFGGGWGLLATAAITGVTMAFMDNQRKAQEAAQAAKEYADSLDKVTGKATAVTRKLLLSQALDGAGLDAWKTQGQDVKEFVSLLEYDLPGALKAVEAAEREASKADPWSARSKVAGDMRRMYDQAADGAKRLADEQEAGVAAADELSAGLDSTAVAADRAAAAEQAAAEATQQQKEAYDSLLGALQAIDDYRNAQASAANNYLTSQRNMIQAEKDFAAALEASGGSLDNTAEAGGAAVEAFQKLVSEQQAFIDAAIETGTAPQEAFDNARASLDAFADRMGMSSEEVRAWAETLGFIAEEDFEVALNVQSNADSVAAKAEEELRGIPRETLVRIKGEDNASDIVSIVQTALDEGIPAETITKLFAENDVQEAAAEADRMVNAVKQQKEAEIHAKWLGGPQVDLSKTKIASVKQDKPAEIKAIDNASWVAKNVKWALDQVQSKTVTITTRHETLGTSNTRMTPQLATGGAIFGPGTGTSDSIPAWLSNGEHVLTAREVMNVGGQSSVYALRSLMRSRPQDLRAALGFAGGGTPGSHPVYVPQPHTFEARSQQVLVPAPEVRPNINVRAVVENPFTGEEIDARTKSVVVKFGGRHQ